MLSLPPSHHPTTPHRPPPASSSSPRPTLSHSPLLQGPFKDTATSRPTLQLGWPAGGIRRRPTLTRARRRRQGVRVRQRTPRTRREHARLTQDVEPSAGKRRCKNGGDRRRNVPLGCGERKRGRLRVGQARRPAALVHQVTNDDAPARHATRCAHVRVMVKVRPLPDANRTESVSRAPRAGRANSPRPSGRAFH